MPSNFALSSALARSMSARVMASPSTAALSADVLLVPAVDELAAAVPVVWALALVALSVCGMPEPPGGGTSGFDCAPPPGLRALLLNASPHRSYSRSK
eukprot:scaffold56111_cov27-Tisochrysis_lutea.AAC.6